MLKHRVHPLSRLIQNDPQFWQKPSHLCCYTCGEPCNTPHPYTIPFSWDNDLIHGRGVYCSFTCLHHTAVQFPLQCGNVINLTTKMMAFVYSYMPSPSTRFPPTRALKKLGGPLESDQYRLQRPSFHWDQPNSCNPYESMIFHSSDPLWKKDFTGTGVCCWYCLQPLNGAVTTVPMNFDPSSQQYEVHGLFHSSGRCAIRYILDRFGQDQALRVFWASELFHKYFSLPARVLPAPDFRLLDRFGGPLSWDQYNDHDDLTPNVGLPPLEDYPYYSSLNPTTGEEIIHVREAEALRVSEIQQLTLVKGHAHALAPDNTNCVQFDLMSIEAEHEEVSNEEKLTTIASKIQFRTDDPSSAPKSKQELKQRLQHQLETGVRNKADFDKEKILSYYLESALNPQKRIATNKKKR